MLFLPFLPALASLTYPVRILTMTFVRNDTGIYNLPHQFYVLSEVIAEHCISEVRFWVFRFDLFHPLPYPGGTVSVVSFFGHFRLGLLYYGFSYLSGLMLVVIRYMIDRLEVYSTCLLPSDHCCLVCRIRKISHWLSAT